MAETAMTCVNCGHPALPAPPPIETAHSDSYRLGRFFAGLQIGIGCFLCVLMLPFWRMLYPATRNIMMAGAAVSLTIGYALWNRKKWGLYLLTVVFVYEFTTLISSPLKAAKEPSTAVILHALMLLYFWSRQRELAD